MPMEDSKTAFLRTPWAASLLNQPNVVTYVPGSRKCKASTEDSLFAATLKSSQTLRSCIAFYQRPSAGEKRIEEVSTMISVGDGLNGHPEIMHGGAVATILDEAMGILQNANLERDHFNDVSAGRAHGEIPPYGLSSFTAELKIRYLKPVHTPATLIATAKYLKVEGKKEWISAEIRQKQGPGQDREGEEVLCATGEALFITPRSSGAKL